MGHDIKLLAISHNWIFDLASKFVLWAFFQRKNRSCVSFYGTARWYQKYIVVGEDCARQVSGEVSVCGQASNLYFCRVTEIRRSFHLFWSYLSESGLLWLAHHVPVESQPRAFYRRDCWRVPCFATFHESPSTSPVLLNESESDCRTGRLNIYLPKDWLFQPISQQLARCLCLNWLFESHSSIFDGLLSDSLLYM